MSSALTVRALTRRFPGASAPTLDGLDLEVPAAACVALLGPSGSGKSTVLRLVAGLDTPDGGQILVDGRPVTHVPAERRRIGMVFQRPRLFPHLDVRDNVAFPLVVSGVSRQEARRDAERFLDLVGLADLRRRRTSTLSGGQEQRVALARALAARPEVLLLDEPFGALDTTLRAEMHALLAQLRAAVEPTLLLVTHDRDEAAVLADSVAVLLEARVAQHDTVERLHAAPASLAVHTFLGGRNAVRGLVRHRTHHSRLGALPLPAPASDGPAVLALRQESLGLCAASDAAACLHGAVTAVRSLGPRARVDVDVHGEPLVVETTMLAVLSLRIGDRVGVVVPPGARHVIPEPASTCPPAAVDTPRPVPRTREPT